MDIQVTGKNRTELLSYVMNISSNASSLGSSHKSNMNTQFRYVKCTQIYQLHFFTVLYGESGHGDITSGSVVGSGNHLLT